MDARRMVVKELRMKQLQVQCSLWMKDDKKGRIHAGR